jgi:hypothetical protein
VALSPPEFWLRKKPLFKKSGAKILVLWACGSETSTDQRSKNFINLAGLVSAPPAHRRKKILRRFFKSGCFF